jgi:hypothetical protein
MYVMIFECLSYFVVDNFILLFVVFVELLWLVDAFFLLFMRLFWLFVFSCRTLKWVRKYYWPMVGMIWARKCWTLLRACVKVADYCDLSSVGTLTCVKIIEICIESAFTTVCVRSVIAGYFLLFWVRTVR